MIQKWASAWFVLALLLSGMSGCSDDTASSSSATASGEVEATQGEADLASGSAEAAEASDFGERGKDRASEVSVSEDDTTDGVVEEVELVQEEEVEESIEEEEITSLTLLSVTPNSGLGSGGEPVIVEGYNFDPDAQVYFGESLAENIYVVDSKTISVDTPPRPAGLVDVRVLNPADAPDEQPEEVSLEDAFVFYNPVSVENVEPQQGPTEGGTPVSIKGSGFSEGSKVLFGLKAAVNVEVIDDSTILAVTPIGLAGATDVHVSNSDGVGSKKKAFFYYEEPEIDFVSPPNGSIAGGNLVKIVGHGFLAGALVRIGGETAEVVESGSATEITVKAPAGSEGAADVEVETGYGWATLGGGYSYYNPDDANDQTVLLGVSPNVGPMKGGDDVFLTAYGLTELADTDVTFNDVSAEVISVNPLTKTVHVKSPEMDALGWSSVTISNSKGEGTIDEGFRFINTVEVLNIAPGVGPIYGGSSVTILGSGFMEGAEVRIGALPAIEVNVIDDTTIECITPPGSPGFVPVQVSVGDGHGAM